MDWKFVWIVCLLPLLYAAPVPNEGMMGEFGDLFGNPQMANHVPRLGRRSLSPFRGRPNAFRFFGGIGDTSSSERGRNLAGFFGPLFNRYGNFRYYGGRPGEELARGLLRDKRMEEEYSEMMLPDNVKPDKDMTPVKVEEQPSKEAENDDLYWKNILGDATITAVLDKMAEIGETREMIEEFNNYEKFGVGNPLPKYLAGFNHGFPAMSPKVKVESSYPSSGHKEAILNKYKSYLPFPRRRKRTG